MKNENEQEPVQQDERGKGDDDAGLENIAPAHALNPEPEISAAVATKSIAELDKQLSAVKRVQCGDGQWEDVPDYPTRQKAIELVLAYRLGRPVERVVKLSGGFQSHNDKVAALCATPEGLRMAIAVGLVQVDERIPGRPTLKSDKNPQHASPQEPRGEKATIAPTPSPKPAKNTHVRSIG